MIPQRVELALNRAASLLAELANGEVCQGIVADDRFELTAVDIEITAEKINSVLGTNMSTDEVASIWSRLQFTYDLNGEVFTVHVPSRRLDITIVEDLIEEAGRIYGYDKIPTTLPSTDIKGGYSPIQLVRNRAHETLKACGLTQVITYSLTSEEKATQFLSLPADVKRNR